jgi:hypothetical protein
LLAVPNSLLGKPDHNAIASHHQPHHFAKHGFVFKQEIDVEGLGQVQMDAAFKVKVDHSGEHW